MTAEEKIKQTSQGCQIDSLTANFKEIVDIIKEMKSDVKGIVISVNKYDVILEKLENLEANSRESNKHIHKRIDNLDEVVKNSSKLGCPALLAYQTKEAISTVALQKEVEANTRDIETNKKHKGWLVLAVLGSVVTALLNLVLSKG